MAKDTPDDSVGARYEYRVWGRHERARKLLARLADEVATETVEDCYLLSDDDPDVNVKVRSDELKIKRLVGRRRGFERWVSGRHRSADTAPAPFDEVFQALRLHKADQASFDLADQVERLDADLGATPVFVTKHRTRYRVGKIRAEVTDITIDGTGEVLHTIAFDGVDLDALVALRKRLRLKGEDNIAVHEVLDDSC